MKNVTVIILMGVEMWRSLLNDPGPDPDFHKNWDVSCARVLLSSKGGRRQSLISCNSTSV